MEPKGDTVEIQLRGAQLDVMALAPTRHTVVLGSAGSGKTTMALRLAEVRANLKGSPEVLVVTYNRALVAYMNALKSFDHGITVDTFHHVCMEYLKGKGLSFMIPLSGSSNKLPHAQMYLTTLYASFFPLSIPKNTAKEHGLLHAPFEGILSSLFHVFYHFSSLMRF